TSLDVSFSPTSINESEYAWLSGSYGSGSFSGSPTLYIDWDSDGNYDYSTSVSGGSFGAFAQFFADDDPTGTSYDSVSTSVMLSDGSTSLTSGVSLTIYNLAPTLTASMSPA